ncbi:MAG TPA: ribonuclease III [Burkholderiales bacterium]
MGYRFNDARLAERALTHRSAGPDHNERLEFLGDGVLGCAVADELYARFPQLPEGKLTQLRARLVREESLVEVAKRLGLQPELRTGTVKDSVLADCFEAVVGAIFVDGGYAAARNAVVHAFGPLLDSLDPSNVEKDPKTRLQELLHARGKPVPQYQVVATHGAPHERSFEVECIVDESRTRGVGTSRQRAEQEAARAMLARLER